MTCDSNSDFYPSDCFTNTNIGGLNIFKGNFIFYFTCFYLVLICVQTILFLFPIISKGFIHSFILFKSFNKIKLIYTFKIKIIINKLKIETQQMTKSHQKLKVRSTILEIKTLSFQKREVCYEISLKKSKEVHLCSSSIGKQSYLKKISEKSLKCKIHEILLKTLFVNYVQLSITIYAAKLLHIHPFKDIYLYLA